MNRCSVLCTVARLLSERSRFRIPAGERYFFSSLKLPDPAVGPTDRSFIGNRGSLPGAKLAWT